MRTILYFQSGLCQNNVTELNGVYRYAKMAKWRVQVVPYANAATNRSQLGGKDAVPQIGKLIDFWKPVGAIVDNSGSDVCRLGTKSFGRLPVVFLDCVGERGAVCVTSDSSAIAEAAAKLLLSMDCAAYGYVPFLKPMNWSRERGERFAELVRMNGRKCHVFRKRMFRSDEDTYRSWLGEWLKKAPHPFGVFAANDLIAAAVIDCAAAMKLNVPREVSVVGVDNDGAICDHTTPTLTSVIPEFERAGYLAAELLAQRIVNPRKKVEPVSFGVLGVQRRESTLVHGRSDGRVAAAVEYIRRHACEKLTAAAVIAQMGCARRTAELRFREIVGRSILEEIQSVRVERAKYLLVHTDDPIRRIAEACGYKTTEQLRRLFFAAEGRSPRAWRQMGG